jgi:GABA permease
MTHVLVIANETAASGKLLDAVRAEAAEADDRVTVVAPVNEPRQGYVVYEDTRRAAAGRRLERTLKLLRGAGVATQGFVVETGPVQAAKDALAQLEPPVDQIIVSTHATEQSGWLRRSVVEDIVRLADPVPVMHVVVEHGGVDANVLVIANETVVSEELLGRIRARAKEGPASFLIISPQSDREGDDETEADRRLRRALTELRSDGIDAHGQIVHPDPFTAVMHATNDERVDEIIVSTYPGERSGWLRRDLIARLREKTGLPVQHVVSVAEQPVSVGVTE